MQPYITINSLQKKKKKTYILSYLKIMNFFFLLGYYKYGAFGWSKMLEVF